jgi:hypothetical protein
MVEYDEVGRTCGTNGKEIRKNISFRKPVSKIPFGKSEGKSG